MNMSTTDEQRLRDALVAAIEPLRMYQAYGWPDRNRVIKHCENALAQQAPTPAPPRMIRDRDESGVWSEWRPAAASEPAAPVDARDALHEADFYKIKVADMYSKKRFNRQDLENIEIDVFNAFQAGVVWERKRAALTRQAAAPEEK